LKHVIETHQVTVLVEISSLVEFIGVLAAYQVYTQA